jgi:hypothetical protein
MKYNTREMIIWECRGGEKLNEENDTCNIAICLIGSE